MPALVFDAEGIHRAVLNVVTNAIDACYDTGEEEPTRPGRVVVSTEYVPTEKLARIVIADNGPGIAPEDIKDIFTLFVSHKGSRGTGPGPAGERKNHARARRPHPRSTARSARGAVLCWKCQPTCPTPSEKRPNTIGVTSEIGLELREHASEERFSSR